MRTPRARSGIPASETGRLLRASRLRVGLRESPSLSLPDPKAPGGSMQRSRATWIAPSRLLDDAPRTCPRLVGKDGLVVLSDAEMMETTTSATRQRSIELGGLEHYGSGADSLHPALRTWCGPLEGMQGTSWGSQQGDRRSPCEGIPAPGADGRCRAARPPLRVLRRDQQPQAAGAAADRAAPPASADWATCRNEPVDIPNRGPRVGRYSDLAFMSVRTGGDQINGGQLETLA